MGLVEEEKRMRYRKGYKYQLAETEVFVTHLRPPEDILTPFISLTKDGVMTLVWGYAWNGPSGPTIDTENTRRGTAFHDAAYQLMRMGLLEQHWRLFADKDLGEFLVESGMWKARAWAWVKGLKWGGRPAADPENRRRVFEVS